MTLAGLPPDLIIRIFTFLPVPDLPKVARASRRLKILAYNDDVYKPKLRVMGVVTGGSDHNLASPQAIAAAEAEAAAVSRLSSKLKQLPGGNMLPGGTRVPRDGNHVGRRRRAPAEPSRRSRSAARVSSDSSSSSSSSSTNPASASNPASSASASSGPVPQITAGIPNMRKSNLVVGAGGIKVIGRSASGLIIGNSSGSINSNRRIKAPGLNGVRARDAFKAIYTELCPYYVDFRSGRSKDSKVFRDNKDLIEVATLLRRIRLLSQAKFIPDMDEVNFSLETTIQWFESMLLGQFERAYDAGNIAEMKKNATAGYELNGGAACVQVFISKNPIFFDHTFNPSLVASKLPSGSSSDPQGYALADEFAKFMDHMLTNCRKQAAVIAKVFNPEMDAMTSFVTKVFEDSITEYLSAVLKTAKERESSAIYLHTLATAVHCCTQFLDFIRAAEPTVTVHSNRIREAIANIFRPYTQNYMELELEHLQKKIDSELNKWKNRKDKVGDPSANGSSNSAAASYLTDAEKAQAHKRQVMNTMKTVLYAPMALGKSLAIVGNGILGAANPKAKDQNESLLDDGEDGAGATASDAASRPPRDDNGSTTYRLDDNSLGSLVSLELCLTLIHANKESLGRALVITAAVKMAQLKANAGKVFIKLLQAVGEGHMYPAFQNAIDRLSRSVPIIDWAGSGGRAVNLDSLQFFELVHVADLIHQMVDVYFVEDVKPWIDENDFLSDVMVEKKSFDRQSDDNVAHGMDKAIQVLINQVDSIFMTTQEPADFNPPQSNIVFDLKPTKACRDVIACLNAHTRLLNGVTNKDTLEVFFGEVGIRLFNVIIKNIKKHQVSHDLNRFYEWAANLRVGAVARLFLVLKELGNLFLADGGQDLKNLVHDAERYHGALRPEDIYELLASRTDYKRIQKHVESKECVVM
ncbi:exocyst complex component Sec10-domain-containing protein [Zopfochytrium polystomum]|nr:exocyst complex component Sec10-domain-containing protein [Zopfochytrium polystomum]